MDFEPGGILNPGVTYYRNRHPWKSEVIVPLRPTPEQLEQAEAIITFQREIDLLDTSFLDD
jgi:hypothetical protein